MRFGNTCMSTLHFRGLEADEEADSELYLAVKGLLAAVPSSVHRDLAMRYFATTFGTSEWIGFYHLNGRQCTTLEIHV